MSETGNHSNHLKQKENKILLSLISGNIIAQLIPLIFSPILSRYYSPEQFGQIALLMGITNPLSVLICLKYDSAIVIPENDSEARDIMRLSFKITLVVSVIVAIICFLIWNLFSTNEIIQQNNTLLLYIPPVLLSIGISTAIGFMFQRLKLFKHIARLKILQMSLITLFNLLFAFLLVYNGLTIGYLIGWMLSSFVALMLIIFLLKINIFKKENNTINHLKKYRHFPIYNGIPEFLNTIALSIPVFIFMQQFGEKETGYLNLCRQVLYFPASFISVALSQYYFQKFSEYFRNKKSLTPLLSKIALLTIPFSVIIILVMVFVGPTLFSFVFGNDWLISGELSKFLCFLFSLQLCVIPMQSLLIATGRNKLFGLLKTLSFIANVILIFPTYNSTYQYIWYYTVTEGGIWIFSVLAIYVVSYSNDKKIANAS